jgi:hypothetical protein
LPGRRLRFKLAAWYNLRQLNTWFAFTPCARAIRATDAPLLNVSSTIWRRSLFDRIRRFSVFSTDHLASAFAGFARV